MMLVTRPESDEATRYLSAWGNLVLKEAKQAGVNVIDLYRKKANRKDFEGRIRKCNPKLVILNGHGNDTCVTGHEKEPLVIAGENENLLEGRITYAISCNAANVLGEVVGRLKNSAFIGYAAKFSFPFRHDRMHLPLEDDRAAPFMEMSNQVTRSLVKGHTVEESLQRSREVGLDHAMRLLSSASDPNARFDANYLLWNLRHQVYTGDGSKRFAV
ncbi:MAG: hypothetical protein WC477_06450 [Patescibacteria group bacterium]